MPTRKEQAIERWRNEKLLRGARRETPRAGKNEERVRRRAWLPEDLDDTGSWDDVDAQQFERVMPRGEAERRHRNEMRARARLSDAANGAPAGGALETGALGDEAVTDRETGGEAPALGPTGAPGYGESSGEGLVIEVSAGLCRVRYGGQTLLCTPRGSLTGAEDGLANPIAAGDRVRVTPGGAGQGVVEAVLPRRTALARPDVFHPHLRQVLAANADQLLVVAAWRDPAFWPELVDRYLVTAGLNGLQPLIVVNKIDLGGDVAEAHATLLPYTALGYRVIFTSAVTGQGLPELREALAGHMTVLAGLSGVGKSTLLGAVQPGLHLRTAEVSDHWHQGRHTTSQAVLHALAAGGGGFVVDTPGIREWGLAGLRRGELGACYPELAALAGACRFPDCTHRAEPGCAVQAALRDGRISAMRYDSYRKIWASLPA